MREACKDSKTLVDEAMDTWSADIIEIDVASSGQAFLVVALHVFECHEIYSLFNLERKTLIRFLLKAESGYGKSPYHNSMHGADVLLGVHHFLSHPAVERESARGFVRARRPPSATPSSRRSIPAGSKVRVKE